QAGRLTYNKYTDGSWEAWEYDKAGRLTKAYNRDSVTEFVRNALGQVIKETQDGRTVEHRYDERSRLSNIVSALEGNITYGYDMKGSINHISAGMSGKRKPWEANIAYDRFGRETSRMMPGCVENTMHYDSIGRPAHQRVRHNGRTLYDKSYTWGDNLRLLRKFDTINGRNIRYDCDAFASLSGAMYGDGSCQWRNPDLMGNVYDSPDRTDRSYGRGGQLREDRKWRYYYDSHGNLVLKTMRRSGTSLETGMRDEFLAWQNGDYAYTWQGNGMLRSVTRPDGKTVTFRYDALGRRIEKVFDGRVYRYLWDGDVILHEWDYAEANRPNMIVTETGEVTLDKPEPVENLITWVYDSDSYVPTAKIVGDKHYSIVSDYIGRPVQAYDDNGNIVWQADYDIYGNVRNLHGSRKFIPFRQLGQYEDEEIGLYYNRFRYYDSRIGNYICQDPIRLMGNNPTLYGYVEDSNNRADILGLSKFCPIKVLGRKVYINSTDFGGGVPTYVDPIIGKTNPTVQKLLDSGASNYDLMSKGYAPIGTDGKQINLHHVIGEEPGPMIELLDSTHKRYYKPLHGLIEEGNSFRNNRLLKRQYEKFRRNYWKERAKSFKPDYH
ncbi:HNH/ENDO VII family nuclease, partial [Prevotella jejuni]|uniref:HNH/ENDO VII family nuclease n=1 Tax=Prevotella jejuni TaxID=1177574 RepID=UPI00352FEEBD